MTTTLEPTIEDLFADGAHFDKAAAIQALKAVLIIQRESHDIYFKGEVKLTTEEKILAYALARKVLFSEKLADSAKISAQEISEKTGLKKGSVDPAFQSLKTSTLLIGSKKDYEIPNHHIDEVIKRLTHKITPSK